MNDIHICIHTPLYDNGPVAAVAAAAAAVKTDFDLATISPDFSAISSRLQIY